ncbi:MAG: hypothetical protein WA823_15955 [Candidatus Acidiferrales bacterium]
MPYVDPLGEVPEKVRCISLAWPARCNQSAICGEAGKATGNSTVRQIFA